LSASSNLRIGYLASRIRQVSGLQYHVEIVSDIDGATLQGVALADPELVCVTAAAVDLLNDDELAWLVAHEFAHLAFRHSAALQEKTTEFSDSIFDAVKESHQKRKELGHGLLRRTLSTGIRSFAAAAATVVVQLGQSREHEKEADEWATRTALLAGFNPAAGASLLRKLHGGSLPSLRFTQLLVSTHPDPQSRVAHILRYSNVARSDNNSTYMYCAAGDDCKCGLPKICLKQNCDCNRLKGCSRGDDCRCGRIKVCTKSDCRCGRPKAFEG